MTERIPTTPPHIAPLPSNGPAPLWSVMIPAYNCSQFLEQTIKSVLSQDPGLDKMQIEVIDDGSTDTDVGELVMRVGNGRVQYHRKEQNMGSLRNFETCINRAQGSLVHILHGDDYVSDGFYNEIEKLFSQYPEAGAAFTDFHYVDEVGNNLYLDPAIQDSPGLLADPISFIAEKQRIQPPAMVVRRSVYEKLGSFYAVEYGEDWEMWARIASRFPIAHFPGHLACYRVHTHNITTQSLVSGQNIKDIIKVISIIQNYIPVENRKRLNKRAKRNFSIYYAWLAHKLYHDHGDVNAARTQVTGALQLDVNKTTVQLALKLYIKLLIRYKQ